MRRIRRKSHEETVLASTCLFGTTLYFYRIHHPGNRHWMWCAKSSKTSVTRSLQNVVADAVRETHAMRSTLASAWLPADRISGPVAFLKAIEAFRIGLLAVDLSLFLGRAASSSRKGMSSRRTR